MKHRYIYILALWVFWIVLSERLSPAVMIAGLFGAVFIGVYTVPGKASVRMGPALRALPLWLMFAARLIGAVVVSNFQVAYIVLSRKMPIAPHVIQHHTELKTDLLKTVFANAITLTPGTMTVDIHENCLQIHCLNESYALSTTDSALEKILLRIQEVTYDT